MNASTLHENCIDCTDDHAPARLASRVRLRGRNAAAGTGVVTAVLVVFTGMMSVWGPAGAADYRADGRFEQGSASPGYEVSDEPEAADFEDESWAGSLEPCACQACGAAACRPGCSRCCPKWQIQVDALMLWQGAIPSRPLYLDSATRATAIDANDLQTPVTIDPRYAIIYNADDCRALEVNYFNLSGFEGEAVTPVTAAAYEMNDLAGLNFRDIDVATAQSQAAIKSLEFNLRRRGWGDIQWISGFRWLEWNQQLIMADEYQVPAPGIDVIGVGTVNNLYGWQWGGDLMLWNRGDRLRVNGVAKAGVYYNHQAGQVTEYVTDRAAPTSVGDADDTVAFVGETGIMASYSLTNWLAIRLGYTFFWLGGVATPADQLADTTVDPGLTPEAKVNPYGSVFLQGVQTGLEARW